MSDPWARLWSAPVLRGLDEAARRALAAAGRVRSLGAGQQVFGEHDPADAFYVVLEGAVELWAQRRGDEVHSVLRTAGPGDTLGEEALSEGLSGERGRSGRAVAREASRVVELPAALFLRGAGRSGGAPLADRELRRLQRLSTRDLLRTMAATRALPEPELDLVLDAVRPTKVARGTPIYAAGDPPDGLWLVVDGLVQLQTEDDDRIHVRAYLTRGDGFGDEEARTGEARRCSAVAMGETRLLLLPAAALRSLLDRNPGLLDRFARIAADRHEAQAQAVGAAAARSTQHVFKDLYRMQMARSLLVIDQETCVRCGHCAWACQAIHGTSRLVRRGDKILTTVGPTAAPVAAPVTTGSARANAALRSLMLPNSCQHCKNPVCMIDCPTGAIGRDPEGEVFIRDHLCTGCGNCAKACPWENIRMAPRPGALSVARARGGGGDSAGTTTATLSAELATKCDLCRAYEAPGCVQACPTGSILRLDPSRDVAEVAAVLGAGEPATAAAGGRGQAATQWLHGLVRGLGIAAGLGLGITAWRLQHVGVWTPGAGPGLTAGVVAAVGMVGLVAYAVPKRIVSLWMRRRRRSSAARRLAETVEGVRSRSDVAPRSKIRPWLTVHLVLGVLTMAAALGHAGLRLPPNPAGSLWLAFWLVSLLGVLGAVAYRVIPRRLAALERRGDLPEDLATQRRALLDRLFVQASGRDELVKTIAARVLVPYARALHGPLVLCLRGRTLAQEEARLQAQIDAMRQGRGEDRLGGLPELLRTAVELRALPARRVLTAMLRGWLPLHIVVSATALALLGLHVAVMLGGP
ncbi:cyclic nucleotide-binding domain-containing protein [Paraliomyxa miuraensis]|uniref:cyclic nucleotide-binding domain-containing protein n=1 Tax=Paraliomyxa miuraensis TaxID=376150 RepID=UPI00225070BB|nr:cyclic nucleotide-binding domain-containing protein [Paraliomyxa miuraensis]MCX4245601.1 cyclic nucleotide-binding domain-containing protein [Paraliomyxa miuraensis]